MNPKVKVKIDDLKEGCIISEDVFSLTKRPIVPNKTIVKKEIIDILKAFLIKEVEIEKILLDGTNFSKTELVNEIESNKALNSDVTLVGKVEDHFLIAVRAFKKEFANWQAGSTIDISNIRQIMIPLIDKFVDSPSQLFTLHYLSTKEEYIYQHSVAVGLLSAYIGRQLNYDKAEILQLALGGCLADCGMAKMKESILQKKAGLTRDEFDEVKQHPIQSYKMIKDITILREQTKLGILQHHERLDGSGYPQGKSGQNISDYAKIIAVADTFHAMTSSRNYRQKSSIFKVLEQMLEDNFGKYDLNLLTILSKSIVKLSVGTRVKLSDDTIAEIIFLDEKKPTRPLVKLENEGIIIPLEKNRQLFIEEILL